MENICAYGAPTLDYIVFENGTKRVAYGGGVYYSILPFLGESGYTVEVYTVYSPRIVGHPVYRFTSMLQYSSTAMVFKIVYNNGSRMLLLEEKTPALYSWNVHSGQCFSIVNPVFHEVDESLLKTIRIRSPMVFGDIQGFVRSLHRGLVVHECSRESISLLKYFDVVHMDLDEAKALACTDDLNSLFEVLLKNSPTVKIVITSRTNPIYVLENNSVELIDVKDSVLVKDKTGAGDFFLGSLLKHLLVYTDTVRAVERAHEETTKWLMVKNASSPPTTS